LTTTFIITQRSGACDRIVCGDNEFLKRELLPDLTRGATLATVGISHLTTSRRHLARPVLRARPQGDELLLDGYTPWVTGAGHAQTLVVGATLDGAPGAAQPQVLVALPVTLPGVCVAEPARLIALSASHTGPVRFERLAVGHDRIVAGPSEQVMAHGKGAGTGGLQTSTLAVGLATAALEYLKDEAVTRQDLDDPAEQLLAEHAAVKSDLLALAEGNRRGSPDQLRARANSLVLRASQAALAAAKGSGFVVGHPAGRWCREALFFLVWSCPQSVVAANLCELAGIEG
jgi:alkylation response protein AidB-like acyl-CoA dehydrogenase